MGYASVMELSMAERQAVTKKKAILFQFAGVQGVDLLVYCGLRRNAPAICGCLAGQR